MLNKQNMINLRSQLKPLNVMIFTNQHRHNAYAVSYLKQIVIHLIKHNGQVILTNQQFIHGQVRRNGL